MVKKSEFSKFLTSSKWSEKKFGTTNFNSDSKYHIYGKIEGVGYRTDFNYLFFLAMLWRPRKNFGVKKSKFLENFSKVDPILKYGFFNPRSDEV